MKDNQQFKNEVTKITEMAYICLLQEIKAEKTAQILAGAEVDEQQRKSSVSEFSESPN